MVDAMSTFGQRPFSGTYNASRVAEVETWLGRQLQWTVLMADRTSAKDMNGSVFGNLKALVNDSRSSVSRARNIKRMNIVLTVPLTFGKGITAKTSQGQKTIAKLLAETAKGKWNSNFQIVAERLAEQGFPNAVIRLGHEMNGPWYPWSSIKNETAYIDAFRSVQTAMKTTNPSLRFEWNVVSSGFLEYGTQAYPGSDVVDIVGLDIYNKSTGGKFPSPFEIKWERKLYPTLVAHQKFARANGKPVSYAEWANGSLDEPMFIHRMADWFTSLPSSGAGGLYYQSYFNVAQQAYRLDNYPNSKLAYAKRFGSN
jgi:hypothetical protein